MEPPITDEQFGKIERLAAEVWEYDSRQKLLEMIGMPLERLSESDANSVIARLRYMVDGYCGTPPLANVVNLW